MEVPAEAHPPGDLVVWRRPYSEGGHGLFRVHSDGSGRELVAEPYPALAYSASHTSISPDGEWVAFDATGKREQSHLFVARLDGSEVIQLTRGPRRDTTPRWSPDGMKVLARCGRQVCLLEPDGSGRAEKVTMGGEPEWSPDGRRIAFTGKGGIRSIEPDGTNRKKITGGSDSSPRWSPDSEWILFTRYRGSLKMSERRSNCSGCGPTVPACSG